MSLSDTLPSEALRWHCDPDRLGFDTSEELGDLDAIVGQQRAVDAINFGVGIGAKGYNLFALGPTGTGKHQIVRHFLRKQTRAQPVPPDICYVHNFDEERHPRKLALPPGRGRQLADDMDQLIDDLKAEIPAAFESEEYQSRHAAINQEFVHNQEEVLAELEERAEDQDIRIIQTPEGIGFAPIHDGAALAPDELDELSDEEREEAQETIEQLEESFRKELQSAPRWERTRRERLEELRNEVTGRVVSDPVERLRQTYDDLPAVVDHLDAVAEDIVDHGEFFVLAQRAEHARRVSLTSDADTGGLAGSSAVPGGAGGAQESGADQPQQVSFRRYNVNVLVDNSELDNAPIVYEDDPTLDRLVGKSEHLAQYGTLITDFNLIQPGALHRANGGYLIVDARKLLMHPLSWEQLKRALFSEQIHIESAKQAMGMASTVTLEPEAIDLDVKVILLGERQLYYKLDQLDDEFSELFKVAADFDETMARPGQVDAFAKLVANLGRDQDCAALAAPAVARVVERAARLAGDREELSTHSETIKDLIAEADYWADQHDRDVIGAADVDRAIAAQRRRSGRVRERLGDQIERETLLIDTDGQEVGQVNGLAVLTVGRFSFGRPHRITARARLGDGELVDIEREAHTGGPLHAKGVLILGGLLGGRFGRQRPLSLTASLVFEQTYGGIDGDSASLAEACALLSELADVELNQSMAVTGSINQKGGVQAIGGVNQKIEGFFDVCQARGLTGEQAVIIPEANIRHLMVRPDVVEAVEAGTFQVIPVATIDQAMHHLTGVEPGERGPDDDTYPADTINGRVEQTLRTFAERIGDFRGRSKDDR